MWKRSCFGVEILLLLLCLNGATAEITRLESVILPDGATAAVNWEKYAFVALGTNPAFISKIDLERMTEVESVELELGEYELSVGLTDNKYLYFATDTVPAKVIRLSTEPLTRYQAVRLRNGEGMIRCGVIVPGGRYALFGTFSSPASIVRIELSTFQYDTSIKLDASMGHSLTAAIASGDTAFFAASMYPNGKVIQVDLESFTVRDTLAIPDHYNFAGAFHGPRLVDYSGHTEPAAVFVHRGQQSRLVKLGYSDMAVSGTAILDDDALLGPAALSPAGDRAFLFTARGATTKAKKIVEIDTKSMRKMSELVLDDKDDAGVAAAFFAQDSIFAIMGGKKGKLVRFRIPPSGILFEGADDFEELAAIPAEPVFKHTLSDVPISHHRTTADEIIFNNTAICPLPAGTIAAGLLPESSIVRGSAGASHDLRASDFCEGYYLHNGTGARKVLQHVSYPQKFEIVPQVFVSLTDVQFNPSCDRLAYWVGAYNITQSGFDLVMMVWETTKLLSFSVDWLAFLP